MNNVTLSTGEVIDMDKYTYNPCEYTIPVYICSIGTYELKTDIIIKLSQDRRRKEGKLMARYHKAITELDIIAFKLGVEIYDILPVDSKE